MRRGHRPLTKGPERNGCQRKQHDEEQEEVKEVLARHLSEDSIRERLSRWSEEIDPSSFVLNPYALSGPLYDRFLARLCEHHYKVTGACFERCACCFIPFRSKRFRPLPLVFHGTQMSSIDSVLCQGILPSYRNYGPCDWFGKTPDHARKWNFPGLKRKLLVSLVLPVKESVFAEGRQVLRLSCASYQLPIGTVECTGR